MTLSICAEHKKTKKISVGIHSRGNFVVLWSCLWKNSVWIVFCAAFEIELKLEKQRGKGKGKRKEVARKGAALAFCLETSVPVLLRAR